MELPYLQPGLHQVSILEALETHADTFEDGDGDKIAGMLQQVAPEHAKRQATFDDFARYKSSLGATYTDLGALHAQVEAEARRLFLEGANELVAIVGNSDASGNAARWRAVRDQLELIAEARNLIMFVRLPAARLQELEAALSLRKIEELEVSLLASLSHARTIEKLIAAGLFERDNRAAVISQETESLRMAGKEAARKVGLAQAELTDEKKRQADLAQRRFATGGLITRAEVASAIPSTQA